jgi:hypothetical protein
MYPKSLWGHNNTPCGRPAPGRPIGCPGSGRPQGVIDVFLVTHLNQMPYERLTFDRKE